MANEKANLNELTDSYERFRESNTLEAQEKHYRGKNNGLSSDEDDLPDRGMVNTSDANEYINEP